MNKKLLTLFSTLFLLMVLAACGSGDGESKESGESNDSGSGDSGKTITLRLAENQPDDYPTTIGDKEFARLVEEKTDGRYKIEVYSGGQLGDEVSVIEQVQLGTID